MSDKWSHYKEQLGQLKQNDNFRQLRWVKYYGKYLMNQGKQFLNLASNDYLALGAKMNEWDGFLADALENNIRFKGGSCSSRLLTGNVTQYRILESKLQNMYGREAALVFNSGYHANVGIIPALSSKNDLIIADKLVHASMIDGMQLSKAKSMRFRHNDMNHLERILKKEASSYERIFILVEGIYSMDGDTCPLEELVRLKNEYGAYLYVDEAHSFGVLGEKGLGLCEEKNLLNEVEFIIGTFGKSAASQGAFIICDQIIKDYLVNTARSLIFSTALAPINIKWSMYALDLLEQATEDRQYLMRISNDFRDFLTRNDFQTKGNSHIIPLVLGENGHAVALANYMAEKGVFAPAIKPPTVPPNEARLRFSFRADLNANDIHEVKELLVKFKYNKD